MKRFRYSLLTLSALALLSVGLFGAVPALAQVDPVAFKQFAQEAGFAAGASVPVMIARIIRTVIGLVGIIAVAMIIYAGFLFMTSGGNTTRVSAAKKMMGHAILGLVIVLSSYAIVQFVLNTFSKAAGGDITSSNPSGNGGGSYPDSHQTFYLSSLNTQCASKLRNLQLQFVFSQTVDPTSATSAIVVKETGGPIVVGTVATSGSHVTFTPSTLCPDSTDTYCFKESTQYQVVVAGSELKATNGNVLKCNVSHACEFSFTTGSGIDAFAPMITMSAPANGDSVIVGDPTLLQAKTNDDTGVSVVDFYVDDDLLFTSDVTLSTAKDIVGGLASNYFSSDVDDEWDTNGYTTNKSYPIKATAVDCAGHQATSPTVSVTILPTHCYDSAINMGEEKLNCGGAVDNPNGYCGACALSGCTSSASCASGLFCEIPSGAATGVCVERPRITLVSPDNGALGNLITISGTGFGSQTGTATVTFLGKAAGEAVSVGAYACVGTGVWTDSQIIVQIPGGAKDGPIEVTTQDGKKDRTDDLFGPTVGNFGEFDVNAITRPGICLATPDDGVPGTTVQLSGLGFGTAPQGSSAVWFKNDVSAGYPATWSETQVKAIVPNMSAGTVSIRVFTGDYRCLDEAGIATEKICAAHGDCTSGVCATSRCSESLAYCSDSVACATGAGICTSVRVGSNKLEFKVIDPLTVSQPPKIVSVESGWKVCSGGAHPGRHCADAGVCDGGTCVPAPTTGAVGQYVTLYGSNFGTQKGTVEFLNKADEKIAIADVNFPPQCAEAYWHNNSVTIKVPAKNKTNDALALGAYAVSLKRQQDGQSSNAIEFTVVEGKPGPSICKLDPVGGPVSTAQKPSLVAVYGENLGDTHGSAAFFGSTQSAGYQIWNNTTVTGLAVSEDAKTGPVTLTDANKFTSNSLNFSVGNCKEGTLSCEAGTQCCGNGSCALECELPPPQAHLAYKISTGLIPQNPVVKVACKDGVISPSPWENWAANWQGSKTACLDAIVTATLGFPDDTKSFVLDATSVVDHVKVEECTKPKSQGLCDEWKPVAGTLSTFATSFKWDPTGEFLPNKKYRVTVLGGESGVRAAESVGGAFMLEDYSWEFSTGTEHCGVGEVIVSPDKFTAKSDHQSILEDTPGYFAQLVAKGHTCQVLSCDGHTLSWSSNFAGATVKEPSSGTALCSATVIAEEETQGTDALIKATLTSSPEELSGTGKLTIEFNDPTVSTFFPNCSVACVNARPWVRFNTQMDSATITAASVLLYQCSDALCAKDELLPKSIVKDVSYVAESNTAFINFVANQPLVADSWYRVVLKGEIIKSTSNVFLKDSGKNDATDQNKYFPGDFSWKFKSKPSDVLCTFNSLSVSPKTKTLNYVGERQSYFATLYGSPDACDASGQSLQNWAGGPLSWKAWNAEDNPDIYKTPQGSTSDVATMLKEGKGSIALSSTLPPYCSASCLNIGAPVNAAKALCGDGKIGIGEECDDNNSTSKDGCSSSCLWEGTLACVAGGVNCCGNSKVEAGEECDDGKQLSGDGCSAVCLNEGSKNTCGDGKEDYFPTEGGEDCDDKNPKNGDGCSNQCLNEGSVLKGSVYAQCGDGKIDKGEDCDDKNSTSKDGCSSSCLNEGTTQCVSLCSVSNESCAVDGDCGVGQTCKPAPTICCGNSTTPEKGEDCDDLNNLSGDGCSPECLWEGSSIHTTQPTFCGDGQIQKGEECDADKADTSQTFSTGGFGVAEIGLNAPKEVLNGYAVSKITVGTANLTGEATLKVQCSCQSDQACGSTAKLGCGSGSCCFPRPKVIGPNQPAIGNGPGGQGYCRNTAVWVDFDQKMDPATFANLRLRLWFKDGKYVQADPSICPLNKNYKLVNADDSVNDHFLARAWHWLKRHVLSWIAPEALAGLNHCIAPTTFKTVDLPNGGQRVLVQYPELLEPNAYYYVEVFGDTNLTDAVPEGVLSENKVGLCFGASCGANPPKGSLKFLYNFKVSTEVCLLEVVDVVDHGKIDKQSYESSSPQFFSKKDEAHSFEAQALTYRDGLGTYEPIQSIESYAWTWGWGSSYAESVSTNIVNLGAGSGGDAQTATYVSVGNNGTEHVVATATISKDTINKPPASKSTVGTQIDGTLEVTALTCERPWPALDSALGFPYVEKGIGGTTASNFGFYYCMDRGVDGLAGDLPELVGPIDVSSTDPNKFFQELLFKVNGTPDAIGIRIVPNPNYLSAKAWFATQNFSGGYSDISLDGYEGIQSGNTAYVVAANKQGNVLYPNIYIVSFNPNALLDAKEIFAQILVNWRFNANTSDVSNVGICKRGTRYQTNASGEYIGCAWDGDCVDIVEGGQCSVSKKLATDVKDCPLNETKNVRCDSDKKKVQNDLKRLTDIVIMNKALGDYGSKNKHCSVTKSESCVTSAQCPGAESCVAGYPTISQGSFVPAMSVSKWDSWNTALSNGLSSALPVDPINAYFAQCKTQGADYESATCFNSKQAKFICPNGSHIYGYRVESGEKYSLYTQLEYTGAPWSAPIDQFPSDAVTIVAEYGSTLPAPANLKDGFKSTPFFCAVNGAGFGISAQCGDGVVGVGEQCEPGQVKALSCKKTTDNTKTPPGVSYDCPEIPPAGWIANGSVNVACKSDCKGFQTAGEAAGSGLEAAFVPVACGNGVLETGETCDDGSLNGTYGHCDEDCSFADAFLCGDGNLAGGEQCDCGSDLASNTKADSWAVLHAGDICAQSNGQYSPLPNGSCSYDCKKPGPSCGDKEVNGPEECDGGTETWAGKLCSDGKTTCVSDNDCPGALAGSCVSGYACSPHKICVKGELAKIGLSCDTDTICGNNGSCSTESYPLTRTRVCSSQCAWPTSPAWSDCQGGAQVCGNGAKEGTEQCDDGNQSNTDSCTDKCEKNICGDGNQFLGVEACDKGKDNKLPNDPNACSANYGAACNYCNTLCQYKTVSGDYCGDDLINGTEFCDGKSVPYTWIKMSNTGLVTESNGTCMKVGTVSNSFTCLPMGICNGGEFNGQKCNVSSISDPCGTDGYCVAPTCSSDCSGACPFAYKTTSLLVQSEAQGSQPTSSIDLYSYLNNEKQSPDDAILHIPACRAGIGITANVDNTKVQKPNVDVVFVTDLSGSMDTQLGDKTRLEIVSEATVSAIDTLFKAYTGQQGGKLKIGLVSYGGVEVKETVDGVEKVKYIGYKQGANVDSELRPETGANKQILKTIAKNYPDHGGDLYGLSNPEGLQKAVELLNASDSENSIQIVILLSDGQARLAIDKTNCDNETLDLVDPDSDLHLSTEDLLNNPHIFQKADFCTGQARYTYIIPNPGIFFYSAVISSDETEQAYMEHLSSMKCAGASMSDPNDCTEGEYAFDAKTADGVKQMYDTIVQSILGATTTVSVTKADGSAIHSATGQTPSQNNATIPFPDSFQCQNKPSTMPIRTSFYGTGTMKFDEFKFEYCPLE